MKSAILLSGNMRTWRLCLPILEQQIIDKSDCDIFVTIDLDNSLQCENLNNNIRSNELEALELIQFIQPTTYMILDSNHINMEPFIEEFKQADTKIKVLTTLYEIYEIYENQNFANLQNNNGIITFDELYNKNLEVQDYTDINNGVFLSWKRRYRQYSVLSKCVELMNIYANNNNITYSRVIRIRPDQFINTKSTHKLFDDFIKTNNKIKFCNENIIKASIIKDIHIDLPIPLENDIYVFDCNYYKNLHIYTNDQFFITSYNNALLFIKFNDYINKKLTEIKKIYLPSDAAMEYMFSYFLKEYNFSIKCLNNLESYFIRELEL